MGKWELTPEILDGVLLELLHGRLKREGYAYSRAQLSTGVVEYVVSYNEDGLLRVLIREDIDGHKRTEEKIGDGEPWTWNAERKAHQAYIIRVIEDAIAFRQQVIRMRREADLAREAETQADGADDQGGEARPEGSYPPSLPPVETGRQGKPTYKTQVRAEVFKRIKDEHPEYSYFRVATEAQNELGDGITDETVRNAYRAMGWKWGRADRVR